jgi:hypothetical protein
MAEGTDEEAGELKAQILDFLHRWPSKYPSPVKIAAATGRSPKEVIDELDRLRAQGEYPTPPEEFPAPPPRPASPDEEQPTDGGTSRPSAPAWDRSN